MLLIENTTVRAVLYAFQPSTRALPASTTALLLGGSWNLEILKENPTEILKEIQRGTEKQFGSWSFQRNRLGQTRRWHGCGVDSFLQLVSKKLSWFF
jgi:hypothetical protein